MADTSELIDSSLPTRTFTGEVMLFTFTGEVMLISVFSAYHLLIVCHLYYFAHLG
jgi:hypothetical protein